jgi:hypothetical protein
MKGTGERALEMGYAMVRALELAARAEVARSSKNVVAASSAHWLWRTASPWRIGSDGEGVWSKREWRSISQASPKHEREPQGCRGTQHGGGALLPCMVATHPFDRTHGVQ